METQKGGRRVFGAAAELEVHNPRVPRNDEYSLAMISVVSSHETWRQAMEAGWIVSFLLLLLL